MYLSSIRGPNAGWLRNVRADPRVRLRDRGGTFDGAARALRPDDVVLARNVYCGTLGLFDRVAYVMHMPGWPTEPRIQALYDHWFTTGEPFAIDLEVPVTADEVPQATSTS